MVRIPRGGYSVHDPAHRIARAHHLLGHLLSRRIRVVRESKVAIQFASGADGCRIHHLFRILYVILGVLSLTVLI